MHVHVSLLQGYKHRNAYITTQGPLENTVPEFWRMIWEFKSKVIVMLSQLQEDGKVLCTVGRGWGLNSHAADHVTFLGGKCSLLA